ncbi:MAG: agmatinase [Gammaproteobacteria bacterium]|nr:MAG: agmatinase [Gammaproteobacteria bacterium]
MTDSDNQFVPVDSSLVPRYGGIPTFMRLPFITDPSLVDIALIGVPWDGGTTNRAGARHGPREIRNMSSFIRRINPSNRINPFELCKIADLGDTGVNPIDIMESMDIIENFFNGVHAAGTIPLSAGGDHLMTLPVMRAIAKDGPVGMVHFDAHNDTSDDYFGGHKYTHGTPFRRAVEEGLLDPKRTVQIGIRGTMYSEDDWQYSYDSGMRVITIDEYFDMGVDAVIKEARNVVGDGPTYVSFDVDGLDPVYAPGTGTPEIGGYSTYEAQKMIRGLRGLNLIGGDVVEVSPPFDQSGNTALVGANLMYEILCVLADALVARR